MQPEQKPNRKQPVRTVWGRILAPVAGKPWRFELTKEGVKVRRVRGRKATAKVLGFERLADGGIKKVVDGKECVFSMVAEGVEMQINGETSLIRWDALKDMARQMEMEMFSKL